MQMLQGQIPGCTHVTLMCGTAAVILGGSCIAVDWKGNTTPDASHTHAGYSLCSK